ncbi:MAG: ATP-binding protein [Deltaproteobacteria bacterium]|nr:ATP-binding protein [Deltaproteobacteria bacterium]
MAYLRRALGATVRKATRSFPAVLVTGARQTGKTTLLRHEFGRTHRFVSLEAPDVRARALADPVSFFREYPAPVMLDEIQYVPELLHYVKEFIDGDRRPGRWLLTGSQSFPLMRGVAQTLAGRVAILTLDALSVTETTGRRLDARPERALHRVFSDGLARGQTTSRGVAAAPDLANWLLRGGFPEPRVNHRVDRQLWFASFVQTYLERDVRDLVQVGDLHAFQRFTSLAAARTGSLLNLADLARDVGVSPPTASRWLSVLEASQLVYLLRPYHRNFGKRLTKAPKLYFLDTGLASYLTGLHDREAVLRGPMLGALTETAVVSEWVKLFHGLGVQPPLYFWRARDLEVDVLVEWGQRLWAIEAKATATPTPHHADNLVRWRTIAGKNVRAVVACQVSSPASLGRDVRAVPWHLAW